jgi:hypothetical protein
MPHLKCEFAANGSIGLILAIGSSPRKKSGIPLLHRNMPNRITDSVLAIFGDGDASHLAKSSRDVGRAGEGARPGRAVPTDSQGGGRRCGGRLDGMW